MNFLKNIASCLWKSVDFRGRAPRAEFWSYSVFWTLSCAFTSQQLGVNNSAAIAAGDYSVLLGSHNLVVLVPILLLVPFAAVAVRRLHDIGVSGWWLLSAGVPIPVVDLVVVGAQVVCFARPGTKGQNRYGPDPLAARQAAEVPPLPA